MSRSSPPDALPTDSSPSQDRVPGEPGPGLGPSDVLLPDPVLAPERVPEVSSADYFDVPLDSSSDQDGVPLAMAQDGVIVSSGPRSPNPVPLAEVPSFRTIDPLRSPPPRFDEIPPTPPSYQVIPPPPPPPPPPGGTRRFNFTFPTWQEIRAAFDRLRFRVRADGNVDPGTKRRKRDRAKETAKGCWRKLGLGRREDRDDEDTQAPDQASSVAAMPVVVYKK